MDTSRLPGILLGFLLAIPCVFVRLFIRFLVLGCGIFTVKQRKYPPAILTDPKWGKHKSIVTNGVRLHYVEAGDPTKPLILFLHGFPEFWLCWRHQLAYFQTEYRVVALDNRGYNTSDKPSGVGSYSVRDLVEDVKGVIQGLGVSQCTLVAHDWGGAIAWSFAAMYPEMVDNLIVCNIPHITALNKHQRSNWRQALKSWYILFFQCPVLPELLAMSEDFSFLSTCLSDANLSDHQEVVEAYKFAFREYQTWNRAINYYRCALSLQGRDWSESLQPKMRNISVRTLNIFGTEDKYLSVEAARDSREYVVDHRLELIEGASHWVQQEVPDTVNRLIEGFIKEKWLRRIWRLEQS